MPGNCGATTCFCSNEAMGGKLWVFWQDDFNVDIVDILDQCLTGCFDFAN